MPESKTLILGGNGRMGRRYAAIVRSLGHEYEAWDVVDACHRPALETFARVIVATPTKTHASLIRQCAAADVRHVLCEKPLCMSSVEAAGLRDNLAATGTRVRIVCNWSYVLPWRLRPGQHEVQYSNWSTGPHGDQWDCCQLHYLAKAQKGACVWPSMALFYSKIDGNVISLTDIDRSYIAMLNDWYEDPTRLWGLEDALAMERKVEAIIAARKETR